jgi:tetratricopeptide (TPR) repeat protein
MKKAVMLIGIFFLCHAAYADEIRLKSGEVYRGKIVERNADYVTIQTGGAPVYLPTDQIESATEVQTAITNTPIPLDDNTVHATAQTQPQTIEPFSGVPAVDSAAVENQIQPAAKPMEQTAQPQAEGIAPQNQQPTSDQKIQVQQKQPQGTQADPAAGAERSQQAGPGLSFEPAAGIDINGALNNAYDFILKKDAASALPILDKIIEADPKNELAYEYRGWCFNYEKKYDEALKDYFKAVELNPQEGKRIIKSIAFVYFDQENYAQASARFYNFLKDFPSDSEAQYYLAFSDFYQNYLDRSLEELDQAEKMGVKDTSGLRQLIASAKTAEKQKLSQADIEKNMNVQEDLADLRSSTQKIFSFKTLASIVGSLVIGVIIIVIRSKGKNAGVPAQGTQPITQQGLPLGPLTAEDIFGRDRFYFSRKWSVTERYYVFDEYGQHILFVEKPIIARNFLASFFGIIAAIGFFILSLMAFVPLMSPGMESVGGLLLATLISMVVSVIGAGAIMSGLEKKRRVIIYRDESKNEKFLEIIQETKVVIIRTVYTLFGPQGQVIAKFRRNHFIDNFRRIVKCIRPDGNIWFIAKEDSSWLAFLRRILPLEGLGIIILTNFNFILASTGRKAGEFNRTSAILDKHVLDLSEDQTKSLDRKAALACAVLLDIRI